MNKVKRFNSEFRGMIERPGGQFVLASEYDKIKLKLEAMESVKLPQLDLVATLTLKDGEYEWDRICYIPDGEHDLYIMKEGGE